MAQPFEKYLAETGQQSTLDELRRNGGYNNALNQYNQQGYYGTGRGSPQYSQNQANDALNQQKQLTQQAISTLQGQQPKIAEIYQGKQSYLQSQIDPTKQRYDALINDIKNQQQTAVEGQTRTTNQEYAKRGITNTSGAYQQGLQDTLLPVNRQYTGLVQQTGLQQEADIKALNDAIKLLGGEQSGAEISLAQAIANAQMGGAGQYGQMGQNLLSNAIAQAQAETDKVTAQSNQNYYNNLVNVAQAKLPGELTAQDLTNQASALALKKALTATKTVNKPITSLWPTGQNTNTNTSPITQITEKAGQITPLYQY